MKNIKLIRELNESIREKDEFETALEEAGIEFDMGDGESEDIPPVGDPDDANFDKPDDELQRIADHCREECADMSDDELRDKIGDDLEQLEYSPEEISDGIDTVMELLGKSENGDDDLEDDEGYEDDGQPSEYDEWQDYMGGDDWDHGQYDTGDEF